MIYTLVRFFLYIGIGFTIFSFSRSPETCNLKSTEFTIVSAFFEAKNLSAKYGEATIEFTEGKIKISSYQNERSYSVDSDISAPPTLKKACSNSYGIPSIKTSFKFSSNGLKDISGTLYIKCNSEFLAFSVISPTGGISLCRYNGKEWEEIKR